jgi:lin2946 protein
MKPKTTAQKILEFYGSLKSAGINLPEKYRLINPLTGANQRQIAQITQITHRFYHRYYHDNRRRFMILGSSPARRGTALTGVPFEDVNHLQEDTGIFINAFGANKRSSSFLYEVMEECSGRQKFYKRFYMSFVCPLGIEKINLKGNWVNCNYYENAALKKCLHPFIVDSLRCQIDFNIDTTVCFCIGSGENFKFLTNINDEYHFFDTIVPLEHPRFIMQYNADRKEEFIKKYVNALSHYKVKE